MFLESEIFKTRFCPSPTGLMHLGNTRTALFNALLAKKNRGDFLLRIEDTDTARSKKSYENILMEDMLWLGLAWQDGPYFQSERQSIYNKYCDDLIEKNLAYPCFCSDEELKKNREKQLSQGKPPRYSGTCAFLSKDEVSERISKGLKPVIRFRVLKDKKISFSDLIKGEQVFSSNDIGDFIIKRTDGISSFIFCNAIDDALMNVTHAFRGEDHLTNTARQIMIFEALNLKQPKYGHIPLIMGKDSAPLSKRNGSRNLRELRDEGFLDTAILNYLARLGHHFEKTQFMTLDQLAQEFSLDSITLSPSKFDMDQLLHWQKLAVSALVHDEFYLWSKSRAKVPKNKLEKFAKCMLENILFPSEAIAWARILFSDFEYDEEQKEMIKKTSSEFFEVSLDLLKTGATFQILKQTIEKKLNIHGKDLFMPLRIVLTTQSHGPKLLDIFDLMGTEKIKERFEKAYKISKENS